MNNTDPTHKKLKRLKWFELAGCSGLAVLFALCSFISVRMAIAHLNAPTPQAILTLGGGLDREQFTAQFAQDYPELPIWVSSGSSRYQAQAVFDEAGISGDRVYLDRRAVDTVTNFTSLVHEFEQREIQHVYLITSDFHMARARAIASIVLGSRGITFTPVVVPSRQSPESLPHIARDIGRSVLWLTTGRTGASLNPNLHVRRQA